MTPAHCEAQLARLGMLRGVPADICEYFDALQDVPDDLFSRAVSHAIRTRQWFPTPAELRADCDAVNTLPLPLPEPHVEDLVGGGRELVLTNPASGIDIRIPITRLWRFDCQTCGDSGWHPRACPVEPCGRDFEHAAHEWVEPCACRSWNPTLRRRREANAKYAQPPEKVGT